MYARRLSVRIRSGSLTMEESLATFSSRCSILAVTSLPFFSHMNHLKILIVDLNFSTDFCLSWLDEVMGLYNEIQVVAISHDASDSQRPLAKKLMAQGLLWTTEAQQVRGDALVVIQDQASSVVYGMPAEARALGAALVEGDLAQLRFKIDECLKTY